MGFTQKVRTVQRLEGEEGVSQWAHWGKSVLEGGARGNNCGQEFAYCVQGIEWCSHIKKGNVGKNYFTQSIIC